MKKIINKIMNLRGRKNQEQRHFYDFDIWTHVGEELKPFIPKGVTLYGEIAGRLPNGKWIQKDYDYGHTTYGVYVFRITYTNYDGQVFEFTPQQIMDFCAKNNLLSPKYFFYGQAQHMFDLDTTNHWHENFLEKLVENYNEKDCFMCKHTVPEEGIVLRKEGEFFEAYKLKSVRFLERETKALDAGQGDFEDGGVEQSGSSLAS